MIFFKKLILFFYLLLDKHLESVERMSLDTTSSENSNSAHQINKMEKTFINKSPLICSESPYTTWSKLKVDSDENILKRQSSGNNNTAILSSSTVSFFS